MEAWDHEPRVRPVPIDDEDGEFVTPAVQTRTRRSDHWTKRPWLPIALSAVAVVGVLASVAVFGAIQHEDPPPLNPLPFANATEDAASESAPVTFAPALQEIIPDITDRLTLIVVGPNGPAAMLWDPSFVKPKVIDLDLGTDRGTDYEASFDSSGRFLALAASGPDSADADLYLGVPTDVGDVDLASVRSYRWHATQVGRIAWIATDQSDDPVLMTGQVDPLSQDLGSVTVITTLEPDIELVRWDSEGFLLSDADFGRIYARDAAGDEQWTHRGHLLATSGNLLLISPTPVLLDRATYVESFTRHGELIGTILDEESRDDVLIRTMATSRNSDLIARIDVGDQTMRIEVQRPQISTLRIIHYNDGAVPIGFTSNDQYVVFETEGENDLLFVRWKRSVTYELDVPNDYDVIGLDIG
jgi:hypothetical protein